MSLYGKTRTPKDRGFRGACNAAIKALRDGRVQHEACNEVDEKNLLLTGQVTPKDVIQMLKACAKTHRDPSVHRRGQEVDVHVLKTDLRLKWGGLKERWCIKLRRIELNAWFVSVHRNEERKL